MKDSDLIVEVAVTYELQEYKRVLHDFIPMYYERTGKNPNLLLPWNWPVVQAAIFGVFVPLMFWWKKSRIGDCSFKFSESGLSRTSQGHTAMLTWDQVKIVHRLSAAYLIELKEGGAMPVPFRVFTTEQGQLFEALSQRDGHNNSFKPNWLRQSAYFRC